ncbi:hypothetical protein [Streptomyces antimycoticus]|uniref:DUF2637 domain-containing protein n=1 Tax=Streptomyces antimycoticus TaxID=68175 RepID=A0A4D4KK76_9ACTN|nr:hypothetical protein [Streptomyces antimycoticus]GDY46489.1 hypothetical protein SANT12839_073710 [Streptomyces antimycoticus]
MSTHPTPAEIDTLMRTLVRILAGVAAVALIFTAVNVTLFAVDHHIPWPIAVLLDPMVALTLTTVLYADARLAAWNIPPPRWSTTLRWSTGLAATVMNTWTSLWPDDHIGWPRHADPAGVLLHAVPPLLLIGLTETVAAYRRCTSQTRPHPTTAPHDNHPEEHPRNTPGAPTAPAPPPSERTDEEDGRPTAATTRHDSHEPTPDGPVDQPDEHSRADADVYARALALDLAARQHTGQPISIRQLRRHLHLGQHRARELRTRLDTERTPGAPAPHPAPQTAPGGPLQEAPARGTGAA